MEFLALVLTFTFGISAAIFCLIHLITKYFKGV
jgi:hypothetical protein